MMAQMLFNIVLLLFVRYASTQLAVDGKHDSPKTPAEVSDPISTFLSELGLITLDGGEVFVERTTPAVRFEDGVKKQTYGRPRSDYFTRIRDNYKTLQRRSGSLNLKDALSVSPKLFGGNVKDDGQLPSADASGPLVPAHLQVRSKSPSESDSQMSDAAEEYTTKELEDIHSPESSRASGTKVVNTEVKIDSTLTTPQDTSSEEQGEPLEVVLVRFGDVKKRLTGRPGPSTTKANDKLVSSFTGAYKEFLYDSYKEAGDFETVEDADPEARSRMLGELLHSESAFDKLAKSVLRNSKWALDSDLSPSSVVDKLEDVSNIFHAIRLKAAAKLSSQKRALEANSRAHTEAAVKEPISAYGGSAEEVAQTRSSKEDPTEATPGKETFLSAYTNNGVPVMLRIGPQAGDPYRFLSSILTSDEVSLRVEVKPRSGDEAIGKETAQSGPENPGPSAGAFYIDLSDINQRNSFLRTLRKFEAAPN